MPQLKRFGECLIEASIINREQLEEALRIQHEQHGFLGQILLEKGWIDDTQLCRAISESLHVNCISLDNILITDDVIQLVPPSLAVTCNVIPVFVHHSTLYLAMENPDDTGIIQLMEYSTGMNVKPLVAPPCQLYQMIERYYPLDQASERWPGTHHPISKRRWTEQRKRLGDLLVETGIITQEQLEQALQLQRGKRGFLGQLVIDMGWATEEEICQVLSEMLGVENVDIDHAQIDPEVMKLIPDSLAESCRVIPLFVDREVLYLAMENPLDTAVIQLIEFSTSMKVEPLVAPSRQIEHLLKIYYQPSSDSVKAATSSKT
ncbi:hypothetical protein GF339_11225 [candidate division KSB3 bacterium]|uniref:Type II secretion system protein GspE N-terminal domain-containing protein n=1 Tax=candidate division KSB3 bacterium TaxID=2044937 RepID=A0A9D5JVR1_9BACT|nr:hypothetical protein [candidate division KSB3 bacterium]